METDLKNMNLNEKLELIKEIEDSGLFEENNLNILSFLSHDEEEEIRAKVAEVLVFCDSYLSEGILFELLTDKSELVRVNACDSLCNSKSPEAVDRLKEKVLKDKSSLVRGYSVLSIGDIVNNGYFDKGKLCEFLRYALKREKVNWVKINFYKILIILGDESYMKTLMDELNNRLYRNRYIAVKALCDLISEKNIREIKKVFIQRLSLEKSIAVRNEIKKCLKIIDSQIDNEAIDVPRLWGH